MKNFKQIALDLCLKDNASFSNFFIGNNEQLVRILSNLHTNDTQSFIYFWGGAGIGKSHLLSSVCTIFSKHNLIVAYVPLEDVNRFNIQMLDGLESIDLLCIDGLHNIAGKLDWEQKIFYCFNELLMRKKKLIITSRIAPTALSLKLLDLKSRMISGLIFPMNMLNDNEKIMCLQLRAKFRGLVLSYSGARFILNHYNRDLKNLLIVLEKLDKASLITQRKLTIPFIKHILEDI